MKKTLLLATCTLLSLNLHAGAAPKNTKHHAAQMAWTVQARDTHGQVSCIEQGTRETSPMTRQDGEMFRSIQERTLVNPG